VAVVKQWRLAVERERAMISCRFADLPPQTGIVRGDWTFSPHDRYFEGEVTPILEKSGEVEVVFHPELKPGLVYLRLVDGVTEEILWWDSCTLAASEGGGGWTLLPSRPGQFGELESVQAD
jgi:hypothetical protein